MRRRAGRITDAAAAAKLAQSATTCGALPASGTKAALPAADATTKTTERMGMEAMSAHVCSVSHITLTRNLFQRRFTSDTDLETHTRNFTPHWTNSHEKGERITQIFRILMR